MIWVKIDEFTYVRSKDAHIWITLSFLSESPIKLIYCITDGLLIKLKGLFWSADIDVTDLWSYEFG